MPFVPVVVRVEKGDEVGVASRDAEVARRRNAAVCFRDVGHGRAIAGYDGGSVISRPVVDDDDLVGGALLAENAFDRTAEQVRTIVGRDHDGGPPAAAASR